MNAKTLLKILEGVDYNFTHHVIALKDLDVYISKKTGEKQRIKKGTRGVVTYSNPIVGTFNVTWENGIETVNKTTSDTTKEIGII